MDRIYISKTTRKVLHLPLTAEKRCVVRSLCQQDNTEKSFGTEQQLTAWREKVEQAEAEPITFRF